MEQHGCQQEIQQLRAERLPFGDVPDDDDAARHGVHAAGSIVDTRIGKPPVFSGDEHADTWIPSDPPSEDVDAQLRYLLVMLTSGSALQIIRQQPSGVQAFRDFAGRYNPRSQARSLAQLQEIMQFDFGHDPSAVTDRLVVFERLIGECET